ncbi:hypothetical protein [Glycomyces sp. YM15]|uniref:hypothetical protein n=1 Tax=Glycomyces sp. YM15 TaxID=2800446 RepID=UPI0019661935|nr:hypothetical protein [Glycomyces sp. YM15]
MTRHHPNAASEGSHGDAPKDIGRVAYVDESEIRIGARRVYLLAATLVASCQRGEARAVMVSARGQATGKLHWHELGHASRERHIKTVGALSLNHVVVARNGEAHETSERARHKTLVWLLGELAERRIHHIVAEARQRKQNDRDLALFRGLRDAHQIDHRMRLDHVPGRDDPLLWIPDMVAGAHTVALRGDDQYTTALAGQVDLLEGRD